MDFCDVILSGARRLISVGFDYEEERKQLERKFISSLRNDCQQWLVTKEREKWRMHRQWVTLDNYLGLSSIPARRKPWLQKPLSENGTPKIFQDRRLERWAEYSEAQFK
ncbi:unnamed protein product [Heterobilharzia americana]|nr:unnamed protein product [Heterobilharzia americana]CAH8660977.1 unnamed protein product [Heterobilharzia americana]